MRLRLMATYLGVPYQAGLGPDGAEATLFSPGPPPEELGFTPAAGHWRKQVSITDLEALWQSRPAGDYRGEPCLVLDDLGDRLHIAYLGRDAARAAQLGYWEIDREVFEVVVARSDVTGLTEQRVDFPLTAAMFPAGAQPEGKEEKEEDKETKKKWFLMHNLYIGGNIILSNPDVEDFAWVTKDEFHQYFSDAKFVELLRKVFYLP